MMSRRTVASLAAPLLFAAGVACITTFNKPKFVPKDGAPAVEARPDGCHVDIVEDGQKFERPHAQIGTVALDWSKDKIQSQGPEGAIKTLKAFACETGAFAIVDLRALAMGVQEGMIYEGTLVTLLGDDGKPLNAKKEEAKPDGGVAAPAATADPAPPNGGGGW